MKFSGKVGNEQVIKFWWRSGSRIRIQIQIRIATLIRRALAEVCTIPVPLVYYFNIYSLSQQTQHHLYWSTAQRTAAIHGYNGVGAGCTKDLLPGPVRCPHGTRAIYSCACVVLQQANNILHPFHPQWTMRMQYCRSRTRCRSRKPEGRRCVRQHN